MYPVNSMLDKIFQYGPNEVGVLINYLHSLKQHARVKGLVQLVLLKMRISHSIMLIFKLIVFVYCCVYC